MPARSIILDVFPRLAAASAARRARPTPICVLLAAPYAPRGGGMGRIMAYVAAQAALVPQFRLVMMETRGPSAGWLSVFYTLRAAIVLFAEMMRGPVVLHVNVAGGISIFRKGVLIVLARLAAAPVVLHLHAADLEAFYARLVWPADAVLRKLFQMTQAVIVLGSPWERFLLQTLGVRPDRIVCMPNAVPDVSHPVATQPRAGLTLAFVGNLLPRKGLADLLRALALSTTTGIDFRLQIAGGGDPTEIIRLAKALGIEARVDVLGWLDRADVTRLFACTDIVVLPSYHEALPLVLLEAACQRCAIVTTRAGAIGEYFTHGLDALLVSAGDVAALNRAIMRLLEDRSLRLKLGRNARALYERSFTMPEMMASLANIYRACIPKDHFADAD